MKNIITAQNIIKKFGVGDEEQVVLRDISLTIQAGEFVAIMGPSGSGKSTLMHALSGMDKVTEGQVTFDGKVLALLKENELADLRRNKMGFIFQQPTLLKNINVLDNIILPAMRDKRKHRSTIIKKAQELMERTGISGLEKRDITQMSGGQLQRAGICRALLSNPKVIFGDEPTGALNSKSAKEIMNIITQINQNGTTVMLVTHDAQVAAKTERILFMRDGQIATEMTLPRYNGQDLHERIDKVTAIMKELGI
ncbi:ABC transporter ATP-binding protein [Lysinibacillus alkalisoli]|uniref:ABC transporter ATP-binding protein n=1 Tax=Lysinibacillus alkalisoli TaxID=1911548 RepID=A0A917G9X4_9BACI|nr:ABC transporter ATP-binding protein [Lysinibacillus alkalisoli]GGG31915.1 ABC transporter ATP-binding protein [Lysinibacillus alkalisoli]